MIRNRISAYKLASIVPATEHIQSPDKRESGDGESRSRSTWGKSPSLKSTLATLLVGGALACTVGILCDRWGVSSQLAERLSNLSGVFGGPRDVWSKRSESDDSLSGEMTDTFHQVTGSIHPGGDQ